MKYSQYKYLIGFVHVLIQQKF